MKKYFFLFSIFHLSFSIVGMDQEAGSASSTGKRRRTIIPHTELLQHNQKLYKKILDIKRELESLQMQMNEYEYKKKGIAELAISYATDEHEEGRIFYAFLLSDPIRTDLISPLLDETSEDIVDREKNSPLHFFAYILQYDEQEWLAELSEQELPRLTHENEEDDDIQILKKLLGKFKNTIKKQNHYGETPISILMKTHNQLRERLEPKAIEKIAHLFGYYYITKAVEETAESPTKKSRLDIPPSTNITQFTCSNLAYKKE